MSGARMVMVITALAVSATVVAGATAGRQATTAGGSYKLVGKWGKIGTTGNGVFSSSTRGIAVDKAGNVYVADTDNRRVQVFSAAGNFLRKWGSVGSGNGQFLQADDVAIAPDGTVWAADAGNERFQLFSSGGDFRTALEAPTGEVARGVAVDADGNVVAALEGGSRAGFRVYAKTALGWGAAGPMLGALPGSTRTDDVEVSANGTIYLVTAATQSQDDRVRRYSADGKAMGSFKLGPGDGTRGLGVDLDCNVWTADTANRRIAKRSPSGKILATASVPDLIASDIAVGPKGDVYAIHQNTGIVHFAEDKSKPGTAAIPGKLTVSKGPVVKIAYTLTGVACPAEVGATASLSGKGIAGKAAGLKLKAGAKNVIEIKLAKGALAKAAASGKATFKIVLKTNGRPTTETRSVTVVVPSGVR